MREFVFLTKALSDKNRLRIIMALRNKELCVCQITDLLNLAPSTVSKHLSILNRAGLIEYQKNGRWVYYHLAGEKAPSFVSRAVEWITNSISNNQEIIQDRKHLKEILKINIHKLCPK